MYKAIEISWMQFR